MQLDERCLTLLRQEVERQGSIAAVARSIDYARTAVSQALAGKYPGDTRHLAAKIVETFADRVWCPHLQRDLAPADCRQARTRPIPTSDPRALDHWSACRTCPSNPDRPQGPSDPRGSAP